MYKERQKFEWIWLTNYKQTSKYFVAGFFAIFSIVIIMDEASIFLKDYNGAILSTILKNIINNGKLNFMTC